MSTARTPQASTRRRRLFAVRFAVFALLLQGLAPLAILPPAGQIVHFAHSHHGGHGEHEGGLGAPRPDKPACPVCQALQSGGTSIAAPAIVAASLVFSVVTLPAPLDTLVETEPAVDRPRARAPPMRA